MSDRRNIFIPTRKARGTIDGDRRQIATRFPKALFDRINKLAASNGRSFNEQTLVLCEAGMREPVEETFSFTNAANVLRKMDRNLP